MTGYQKSMDISAYNTFTLDTHYIYYEMSVYMVTNFPKL